MRSPVAFVAIVLSAGSCAGYPVEGPIPMGPAGEGYQYAYNCGDQVLNDQLTSGGQRVTTWMPCWNVQEETRQHEVDVRMAADEQKQETEDAGARVADALVEREAAACARIPRGERGHSPFVHQREIVAVLPHRVAGTTRGVTVIFHAVPGLDAAWLRDDIACHQAHVATLGHVPMELAGDPTLLPGAQVDVEESRGLVTVIVSEPTPDAAERAVAMTRAAAFSTTAER
jgi:hypothetical protein